MAGTNAELTRNYPSGTFSRDHAGRFSHLNASRGVTPRCGTGGAAQIFKRNEDHREIPKNSKNLSNSGAAPRMRGRPDGGCGKDSTARTAKCTSLYMHPPSSCGVGAAAVHRPTSAKGRRRRGHTNGALRQGGSRMESPLGQSRRGAHVPARCATRRLVDVGEGWLKLRIRCAQ